MFWKGGAVFVADGENDRLLHGQDKGDSMPRIVLDMELGYA
jgi:hypothetical protein